MPTRSHFYRVQLCADDKHVRTGTWRATAGFWIRSLSAPVPRGAPLSAPDIVGCSDGTRVTLEVGLLALELAVREDTRRTSRLRRFRLR
jgi:hypothetical protein